MKPLGELTVGDYMNSVATVASNTDKLTHAIGILEKRRLSVLPVVNGQGTLVGILTTTDLIEHIREIQSDVAAFNYVSENTRDFLLNMLIKQGDNTLVSDVMTEPVDTVTTNTNLVVAARIIVDHGFHHLPVVNDSNKPLGVISTSDFVRAVADYGALLAG